MDRLQVRGPVFEGQRFLQADGTVRFLDVTAEMVAWGQTRAILTTLRDADRRRTLEREIFWNGASADRCTEMILWADADGLLCHVNETACRSLGFAREELIGKPMAAIDPGFGAGLWPVHWEEVKARGCFQLTTRFRKREGGLLDIEAEVRHLCHAEREYHCLIARLTREGERSRNKSD
jgi:PAS domain S-box-containing protein